MSRLRPEKEIIRLIADRNPQGIEELLRHYGPLMRYVIAPILQNPHDQDDCLSEVSLKVWEKIATYDPARGNWTAWLTAVTRNTALNKTRHQTDAMHQERTEIDESMPSGEPTPEEILLREERQRQLTRALNTLPKRDQVLFYRKYYYQQSTAQIARELGTTERAVEGRLYRIRKKLQKELGGDEDDR